MELRQARCLFQLWEMAVPDLTGTIESAGVEKQPGVEHLRCKAQAITAAYYFDLAA